jgi:histidinol dehydrogenase
MKILDWNNLRQAEKISALQRPKAASSNISQDVSEIISAVRENGDQAIAGFTRQFDGVVPKQLRVSASEIDAAWQGLGDETKTALQRAYGNIKKFHCAQIPTDIAVEVEPGLVCKRLVRPLDCVGLYVPGGSAPLFSSLLMAAIPAKLAKVSRIVIASPPNADGMVPAIILAVAKLCDVDEVFCVGGAQAIAAMAFGTETIPKVNKIFGPGNGWVNAAKMQVAQIAGGSAIDLPAGPSEVMVLADSSANTAWVAADLLSQAEHDPQSQVILLTTDLQIAKDVKTAVIEQLKSLPRREIAAVALKSARLILVSDFGQMLEISNEYAPEHLIINTANADELVAGVRNTGSVFVGANTPEALGDYASGTNHVLPTNGAARSYSGLGTQSFVKFMTVQRASKSALRSIGSTVQKMAQLEGLQAHANAVSIRLEASP